MKVDYTDFGEVAHQDKLRFFCDSTNPPTKVNLNGTMDIQGAVVGILDGNGILVVECKHDAWGKPLSTTGILADTLGTHNPFRYRKYIYDPETGMYDLYEWYYSPD